MAARNDALITPQILVWARERIRMSIEIAANAAAVTVDRYCTWEEGEALPTVNQAKAFAKKAHIPYAWLFLPTPPEKCKLPHNTDYRTFANQPVDRDLMQVQTLIVDAAMRREAMIELYTEMDMILPEFVQYIDENSEDDSSSIAQTIRNLLGLTLDKQASFRNRNEAFNYYLDAFSAIGILVFQTGKISPLLMRGMSIYEQVFPVIVVNRKDEYNARIFSLFHEFVHILTRTPGICDALGINRDSRFAIETKCNGIAAEALVPGNDLLANTSWIHIRKNGWDDTYVRKIANDFVVSREVIIGRLWKLDKITLEFYQRKLRQYSAEYEQSQKMKSTKDGFLPPSMDISSQVGKLYARTVLNAYNQEVISPRDASQFLSGLRMQHFDKVERWCFS